MMPIFRRVSKKYMPLLFATSTRHVAFVRGLAEEAFLFPSPNYVAPVVFQPYEQPMHALDIRQYHRDRMLMPIVVALHAAAFQILLKPIERVFGIANLIRVIFQNFDHLRS